LPQPRRRTLVLGILAILPLAVSLSPASAADALLPDTRFATPYYVQDSGRPGPTVLVTGGIHGDEQAGAAAAEEIRTWTVVRGRLIVIPRLNVPGLIVGRRTIPEVDTSLADLNRDFPRVGREEPPRGTPATEIWEFAKKQKPTWLVDLHESRSLHGTREGATGNTLLPCPSAEMDKMLPVLLTAINATLADPKERFVAARRPKDGTLSRAAGEHLGINSLIIETTKPGQKISVRVRHHTTIVRALLVRLGMLERP
jgi:predicted deacylase